MRHRLTAITLGAALGVGTLTASAASAAPVTEANVDGARCVAAGVAFLADNGLLRDAALRRIDYSTLADPENGPIYTSLPEGSYLSLGTVIPSPPHEPRTVRVVPLERPATKSRRYSSGITDDWCRP